jgi:hypothetical protein
MGAARKKAPKEHFWYYYDTNLCVLRANWQERTQFKSGSWHYPKRYARRVIATETL